MRLWVAHSMAIVGALAAIEVSASPITPLFKDKYSSFDNASPAQGSRVSVGLIGNDQDSFKLGEYDGLYKEGIYGFGEFFSGGQIAESEVTYRVEGNDLGLDSREILGRLGFAGGVKVNFAYRELPHYQQDLVLTPYGEAGNNNWVLPQGWVSAGTVAGLTSLNAALQTRDTDSKRRRLEMDIQWPLNEHWSLAADYRHERKRGRQLTGAVFGIGGTQLAVRLPASFDRETDDAGLALAYSGQWGSITGGYRYSRMSEDSDPLTLQNPFTRAEFADAANYPGGYGRLAAIPDNRAHSLFVNSVFRLGRTTRLSFDLQRSRHEQDDAFLPYSVNPDLDAPVGLPAADLNGELIVTHASFALTGNPTARSNLALRYRYTDRDNNSDRLDYALIVNDIEDQGGDPASGDVRVNRPFSRRSNTLDLQGGYRLTTGWKLSAGLERETIQRDFLPVDKTEEDAAYLKLDYRLLHALNGWAKWRHADRTGDDYIHNAAYLAGHTQDFVDANGPNVFVNDPAMRQYFLADRQRDQLIGLLNWSAADSTSVSLKLSRTLDDYDDSDFGLTEVDSRSATVDVSYAPGSALNLFAYTSLAQQDRQQSGFQWQGFLPQSTLPPLRNNSANGWQVDSEVRTSTFGTGLQWAPDDGRLSLDLEYAYTRSDTDYDFHPGTRLLAAPLPDLDMRWRDVTARARYRWRKNVALALEYRYRDYATSDFAMDGVNVDSDASVIFSGAQSPNFTGNSLLLSVTYDFTGLQ